MIIGRQVRQRRTQGSWSAASDEYKRQSEHDSGERTSCTHLQASPELTIIQLLQWVVFALDICQYAFIPKRLPRFGETKQETGL